MRSASKFRLLSLTAVFVAAATSSAAQGFCDLVFRDVVPLAPVVLLAEYERESKDAEPYLHVVEVLKGESDREQLRLGENGLKIYNPRRGDRFVLALTVDHTLFSFVQGMGACSPINVLAIRKGKLRPTDREAYDGIRKAMTFDELRADITQAEAVVAGFARPAD